METECGRNVHAAHDLPVAGTNEITTRKYFRAVANPREHDARVTFVIYKLRRYIPLRLSLPLVQLLMNRLVLANGADN